MSHHFLWQLIRQLQDWVKLKQLAQSSEDQGLPVSSLTEQIAKDFHKTVESTKPMTSPKKNFKPKVKADTLVEAKISDKLSLWAVWSSVLDKDLWLKVWFLWLIPHQVSYLQSLFHFNKPKMPHHSFQRQIKRTKIKITLESKTSHILHQSKFSHLIQSRQWGMEPHSTEHTNI